MTSIYPIWLGRGFWTLRDQNKEKKMNLRPEQINLNINQAVEFIYHFFALLEKFQPQAVS